MSSLRRIQPGAGTRVLRAKLALLASSLISLRLTAATPVTSDVSAAGGQVDAGKISAVATNSAAASQPTLQSPVEFFRQLLAMPPADRKKVLANRPPEIQKQILAKVREYESLPPEERELRLEATELRWYLLPLMRGSRTHRAARLALIPPRERELVEERLDEWDLLPPAYQQQLLHSEVAAHYFAQLGAATQEQREQALSRMSPARRRMLREGLDYWRGLTAQQRQQTLAAFEHFFQLTSTEKTEALDTVSDAIRREMERTLRDYSKLTPAQREQCIRSFEKFARMSVAERELFLKNAERWIVMTPAEREKWRELVELAPIQPPLPPGFKAPPRRPLRIVPTGPVTTNRD